MSLIFFLVISSTLLAILLIICVTVLTMTIIILVKGKLKVKRELEQVNELLKTNSKSCGIQQTDVAIDTIDNTAYGLHTYS